MAMKTVPLRVGVDVAKATLAVARSDTDEVVALANESKAIRGWLKTLSGPVCLAVEATNVFHLGLIEQARKAGHTVYVVDGYRLKQYRESIGGRAKTDLTDARLLLRYLTNERQDLRTWSPPPKGYATLQRLLRRRAVLTQAKVTLRQSLADLPELQASTRALLRHLNRMDALIKKRISRTLADLEWKAQAHRCQAIEGFGPVISAALTMVYHRGAFASADAFIAFMGMDVRVRDSGTFRGRRKLTKRGDPEVRRLLYLAAMSARRSATWRGFYDRAIARGMTPTQALVALGRKLARIAFALLKTGSEYQPARQGGLAYAVR
ncbi:MAG TPA: transposase [Rhodanobacter sp.]|nr:transposase [Rhodanobacter sp.]